MMKHFALIAVLFSSLPLFANELPPLNGDGVADDTAAIQALLDSGTACVSLPVPKKHYTISKPLRLHSRQTLQLAPTSVIRLADGANCYMLMNNDPDGGDKNITVTGGTWDGNNEHNVVREGKRGGAAADFRKTFIGFALVFKNVQHLHIEKLTVKDPCRFGIEIAACQRFTVNDISFDYNLKQPSMDGVHIHGPSRDGRITNLRGDTSDDMVGITSDDADWYEVSRGEISDLQIDGLFAGERSFRGVRFLSKGTPIKRVSISHLHGNFYRNAVAFTHWRDPMFTTPVFEDFTICHIYCAKVSEPDKKEKPFREDARRKFALIGAEGELILDNLTISNVHRREYMPNAAPTLYFRRGTVITSLRLRDIEQINRTDVPLPFFHNEASVMKLFVNGVVIREQSGEPIPQTGSGNIVKRYGDIVTEKEQEITDERKRLEEELKTKPANKEVI